MKSYKWLPLAAILLTLCACKKAESKGPTGEPATPQADPAPAAPAKPMAMKVAKMAVRAQADQAAAGTAAQPEGSKPVTISKDRYDVTVNTPAGVAGTDSVVTVTLTPKKGWHVNQDFPTKLTITPPAGVTLAKDKLKKADAAEFNDNTAKFAVKYKAAAAGDKSFSATFKFAVCSAATCDPKTEKLAWNVSVK